MDLIWKKLGGYYFGAFHGLVTVQNYQSWPTDVGASQKIIDGKIKLKSDGPIASFTPTGLRFEDGSTLDADVILFATG